MKFFKQFGFRFWLISGYILLLIACFFGFVSTALVPKGLVLEQNDQIIDSSKQIYFANYQQGEIVFKTEIYKSNFSQNIVSIQVDDCLDKLVVNNQVVDLGAYTQDRFCSWDRGILIDLGKYLKSGENQLEIVVSNYGGEAGLKINPNINDPVFQFILIISLLVSFALLYEIIRGLQLDHLTALLFIAALAIRLIYLNYTGFNARQHDALGETGHLGYINYVATNFRLPDPATGFEYHQAPLYYVISGGIMWLLQLAGVYNVFDVLQLFSLAFFLVFAGFATKLLAQILDKKWLFYLSVSLLLFWPSGIIHSVRITNDNLFWALFAGFIYYLFRWLNKPTSKNFFFGCLFLALGMVTKTSMVLALPMAFMALVINIIANVNWVEVRSKYSKLWQKTAKRTKNLKKSTSDSWWQVDKLKSVCLALLQDFQQIVSKFIQTKKALIYSLCGLFVVGLSTFINPDLFSILMRKPLNQVIGSTQLNDQLKVGEGLANYLYFDWQAFLTVPFMSSWTDAAGRQWFWNFFLKSSLFGEFSFATNTASNLAILISFCCLALILCLIYYLFTVNRFSKEQWLMLAVMVILIVGNMFHRAHNPYAPNSDFRFVFPVLIPFVYFIGKTGDQFYTKKQFVGWSLVAISSLVLVVSSMSFFVGLFA